jgi:cytochrome P450
MRRQCLLLACYWLMPAASLRQFVAGQQGAGALEARGIREAMPLLHACVSEALRLRPPLIFLMRTAMVDLDIQVPQARP